MKITSKRVPIIITESVISYVTTLILSKLQIFNILNMKTFFYSPYFFSLLVPILLSLVLLAYWYIADYKRKIKDDLQNINKLLIEEINRTKEMHDNDIYKQQERFMKYFTEQTFQLEVLNIVGKIRIKNNLMNSIDATPQFYSNLYHGILKEERVEVFQFLINAFPNKPKSEIETYLDKIYPEKIIEAKQ